METRHVLIGLFRYEWYGNTENIGEVYVGPVQQGTDGHYTVPDRQSDIPPRYVFIVGRTARRELNTRIRHQLRYSADKLSDIQQQITALAGAIDCGEA